MQHLDLVIFLHLSLRVELRFLRQRVELWGTLLICLTLLATAFHCQASHTLNWGWLISSYSISLSARFRHRRHHFRRRWRCCIVVSRGLEHFSVLCWRNVNCSLEKKLVNFFLEVPGFEEDVFVLLWLEADPQNLTFEHSVIGVSIELFSEIKAFLRMFLNSLNLLLICFKFRLFGALNYIINFCFLCEKEVSCFLRHFFIHPLLKCDFEWA